MRLPRSWRGSGVGRESEAVALRKHGTAVVEVAHDVFRPQIVLAWVQVDYHFTVVHGRRVVLVLDAVFPVVHITGVGSAHSDVIAFRGLLSTQIPLRLDPKYVTRCDHLRAYLIRDRRGP